VEASVTLEGKVMSGNNVRKMTDFIKWFFAESKKDGLLNLCFAFGLMTVSNESVTLGTWYVVKVGQSLYSPGQALGALGGWGSQNFDNRHMKVVRLLVPRTGRLYIPGSIPGIRFFYRRSRLQGHIVVCTIMIKPEHVQNYCIKHFFSVVCVRACARARLTTGPAYASKHRPRT
jgi:hypothetical protein